MNLRLLCAWGLALVLLLLHLGSWNPVAGAAWIEPLPAELVWRLIWMALALAYLLWFTLCVWREES